MNKSVEKKIVLEKNDVTIWQLAFKNERFILKGCFPCGGCRSRHIHQSIYAGLIAFADRAVKKHG